MPVLAMGDDPSIGNYNPKYHFQAAQSAGFALTQDNKDIRTL